MSGDVLSSDDGLLTYIKRLAAERDSLRVALEQIASASPSLHNHQSGEHRCLMCQVMIDTAREALGYKEWPAEAKTLKDMEHG
jgi:hypothetical protein